MYYFVSDDNIDQNSDVSEVCSLYLLIWSANDIKIFIVLSESPLNARKIPLYRCLISFLVSELLRFKGLKNDWKNGTKNARSWIKSIKIDKICDVMWWTCDSKLCLGKYLSESFETLKAETTRHYAKHLWKKLVVIVMMSVPGPFNGYHEMKHNSAIICRNQLEFWNQKADRVSHSSLKILVLKLMFSVPDPLF